MITYKEGDEVVVKLGASEAQDFNLNAVAYVEASHIISHTPAPSPKTLKEELEARLEELRNQGCEGIHLYSVVDILIRHAGEKS